MNSIERLRVITDRLEAYDTVLTRFVEQVPLVVWCKRYDNHNQGSYVFISRKYGEVYNLDPECVIGQTDEDIWPEEVAQDFRRNDLKVLRSRKEIVTIERATSPRTSNDEWDLIRVIKFPICAPDGVCNLVGGIAFPLGGKDGG